MAEVAIQEVFNLMRATGTYILSTTLHGIVAIASLVAADRRRLPESPKAGPAAYRRNPIRRGPNQSRPDCRRMKK